MSLVAAFGRGDPADGVESLDVRDRRESAATLVILGLEQEPGDRFRIRRIGTLEHCADDRAAVLALPGRAGKMAPHDLAAFVEQLGLRRLEGPDERSGVVGIGLTDVDLDTTSLECEEQDGVRRRLQVLRDGRGASGRALSARRSTE